MLTPAGFGTQPFGTSPFGVGHRNVTVTVGKPRLRRNVDIGKPVTR